MGCHALLQGTFPNGGSTYIPHISCTDRWLPYHEHTWEAPSKEETEAHSQRARCHNPPEGPAKDTPKALGPGARGWESAPGSGKRAACLTPRASTNTSSTRCRAPESGLCRARREASDEELLVFGTGPGPAATQKCGEAACGPCVPPAPEKGARHHRALIS